LQGLNLLEIINDVCVKLIFREEALTNMKISIEVRKCILDMLSKVEKASKEEQLQKKK